MKKILMAVLIITQAVSWSFADNVIRLTTSYPSPYGNYKALSTRDFILEPKTTPAEPCTIGSLYVDNISGNLFLCKTSAWEAVGGDGMWEENYTQSGEHMVFIEDETNDLFVGIDTNNPEFKLTLEQDGGLLAKGTLGSGAILNTTGEGARMIWYPRKGAFRAGYLSSPSFTIAGISNSNFWNDTYIGNGSVAMGQDNFATGENSFAMGYANYASGYASVALNRGNIASGQKSLATGYTTEATNHTSATFGEYTKSSGIGAIASGNYSEAKGNFSLSLGDHTLAESYAMAALGRYNETSAAYDKLNWVATDPVFAIGIGSGGIGMRKNAVTVLKNGLVGIGTSTPDLQLTVSEGGIISNTAVPSGTFPIAAATSLTSTGAGAKFIWYPRKAALRAGYVDGTQADDANIGLHSIALGMNNVATAERSIAIGDYSIASGHCSQAIGHISSAYGSYSTALAKESFAEADFSTALGYASRASGGGSVAIGQGWAQGQESMAAGYGTRAGSFRSTVMGTYNVTFGGPTSWLATDPVFIVGNGSNSSSRSNAMTILKNGNVGIGTDTAKTRLEVNGIIKTTPTVAQPACNSDTEGGIYYDDTTNHLMGCDGFNWKQLDN